MHFIFEYGGLLMDPINPWCTIALYLLTRFTKEWWSPVKFKTEPPIRLFLYHIINIGLLFPHIPKRLQTFNVWRHNGVIRQDRTSKLPFFSKYGYTNGKIKERMFWYQIFAFSLFFGLKSKKIIIFDIPNKFYEHASKNFFFQMAILNTSGFYMHFIWEGG